MAATPQNPPLSGLARALVQAGQLKEVEAEQLLAQAHNSKTSLIEQIITSQKASALDIARFVADTFGYPLLDLNAFDEAHIPSDAIDRKLIATHKVIPLNKRGNRLSVAIADPTNLRAWTRSASRPAWPLTRSSSNSPNWRPWSINTQSPHPMP
jgi:type IV pilus assembly protein PilB